MRSKILRFAAICLAAVLLCGCAEATDSTDSTSDGQSSIPIITTGEQSAPEDTIIDPDEIQTQTDPAEETGIPVSEDCRAVLTSLSLTAEKNGLLAQTMDFEIDETSAYLYVSYQNYADISVLKNAFAEAAAENGTVKFIGDGLNADGSLDLTKPLNAVVTDDEGRNRIYSVTAERQLGKLPIVNMYLDGDKQVDEIDRYATTPMSVSIDCSGAPEFEGLPRVSGTVRGRGHSTWKWDKKPYKIKLDDKAEVLGLTENRDWILLSNYADKSLMRDTLAYTMGKVLDNLKWTPTQYPVDLFVNGEYRGVYSIGEHMEAGRGRVELEYSADETDTGYLFEVGGADSDVDTEGVDYFHTESEGVNFITFTDPDPETITEAQRQFVMDWFNKADEAVVAGAGYEEYIDVDSLCDWLIMHELSNNTDCIFRRSCYITKEKGGKLTMGPIWDFDLAFGNFVVDNQSYNTWACIGSKDPDAYLQYSWCNEFMNNAAFREKLKARWLEVRDTLLQTAMDCIDYYAEKIYPSQEENFKVWPIWDVKAGYSSWNNFAANTYDLQIQYLKDFLNKRAAWIDENI